MNTKQIVFTKAYMAELLDAECLPPKENEVPEPVRKRNPRQDFGRKRTI